MAVDPDALTGTVTSSGVGTNTPLPEPDTPKPDEPVDLALAEPEPVPVAKAPAEAAVVAPQDDRQLWLCVTPEGARTIKDGAPCPPFHADAHLSGLAVRCPNCGSISVRAVEVGSF